MKAPLIDETTRAAAQSALEQLWQDGSPVVRPDTIDEIVARGWRRWTSYRRRHPRGDNPEARIEDLAKGLCAAFESTPDLVGPLMVDYRHLAHTLAATFADAPA